VLLWWEPSWGLFAIASALIRVILPWIARRLQEYRLLTGAMILAAAIFGNLSILRIAIRHGRLFCLLRLGLGRCSTHDHEHFASNYASSQARRGTGACALWLSMLPAWLCRWSLVQQVPSQGSQRFSGWLVPVLEVLRPWLGGFDRASAINAAESPYAMAFISDELVELRRWVKVF
jgi:hypothetical protein